MTKETLIECREFTYYYCDICGEKAYRTCSICDIDVCEAHLNTYNILKEDTYKEYDQIIVCKQCDSNIHMNAQGDLGF